MHDVLYEHKIRGKAVETALNMNHVFDILATTEHTSQR